MKTQAIIAAAASLFAATTFIASTASAAGVHCGGTNACKGTAKGGKTM